MLKTIAISLLLWCVIIGGILIAKNGLGQEADVAEAVFQKLQEAKHICTPQYYDPTYDPARYDMGCDQDLVRCDMALGGENFWSIGYASQGGGPFLDATNACEIATKTSGRGCYRVKFQGTNVQWTVVKQTLKPARVALCFPPDDQWAVPPDMGARSWYYSDWRCSETDETGEIELTIVNGAYARAYKWLGWAEDPELQGFGQLQIWQEPGYWDAYESVRDGYTLIRGYGYNPHPPWTDEAQREAWDKRHALAGVMARGTFEEPQPLDPVWLAAEKVCEFVINAYLLRDHEWLREKGWPETDIGDAALTAALDSWYRGTGGAHDPDYIFGDDDVAVEETTWGQVKSLYHKE